jgi:hypothetical protein
MQHLPANSRPTGGFCQAKGSVSVRSKVTYSLRRRLSLADARATDRLGLVGNPTVRKSSKEDLPTLSGNLIFSVLVASWNIMGVNRILIVLSANSKAKLPNQEDFP